MDDVFLATHDVPRQSGEFHLNSADPPLVLIGRPLWWWSEHHGGEHFTVKVLEVPNLLPLVLVKLTDVFLKVATDSGTYTRSVLLFVELLLLSSAQWWTIGNVIVRFKSWNGRKTGPSDQTT